MNRRAKPLKKVPQPGAVPTFSERTKNHFESHRRAWTVGGLIAVVGLVATLVTILDTAVPWVWKLSSHYQTKTEAEVDTKKILNQITETESKISQAETRVKLEALAHDKIDRRNDAWQSVGISRIEILILRNRVNECNVMKQRAKALTSLEISVCQQYDDELKQGQDRFEKQRDLAQSLSRSQ